MHEENVWRLNYAQIDNLLETYNSEDYTAVSTEIINKILSTDKIIINDIWGGFTLKCVSDSWGVDAETGVVNYRTKVFTDFEPALSMSGYGAGYLIGFTLSQVDHGEEGLKWHLIVYTDEI